MSILSKIPGFTKVKAAIGSLAGLLIGALFILLRINSRKNDRLEKKNEVLENNLKQAQEKHKDEIAIKQFEVDREKAEREMGESKKDHLKGVKKGQEFKVKL